MAAKELHFFPGPHLMVWVVDGKVALKAEAWGGEEPVAGVKYDVMKPRPTTPGKYVIYSYEPYRTNTWALSKIRWGTKLKLDAAGGEVLYETGLKSPAWKKVQDTVPGMTKSEIQKLYYSLYGDTRKDDPDGDYVPDTWLFNDFGAMAVRYFRDRTRNKKLDTNESLSGEMIHTTPDNEAEVATAKAVTLTPSHGCIHLNPTERDRLHKAGAFERGSELIVHPYKEAVPAAYK